VQPIFTLPLSTPDVEQPGGVCSRSASGG
jgi:hypothetical protein